MAAREIMKSLDDNSFQALAGPLNSLPDDYREGEVLEIARAGDFYVEHMIAVNSRSTGNVYFRIIFEKFGDDMTGVQISFKTRSQDLLNEWPILQEPVRIGCYHVLGSAG